MSAAGPGTPATADVEEYYAALWSKPSWNEAAPNEDETARWRAMEPLVARALAGVGAPRILDLGCGRGWLTHLLSRHGAVEGIDPVAAGVDAARQLFPHLPFRVAGAADLLAEGAAGSYHLVVSSEVIEHVPDGEKATFLDAAAALLAPSGHLLLTTPRGELWEAWRRGASRTQPIEEWVGEWRLDELARGAGLERVARHRAHRMRRPLNWQGWLLQRVLLRRYVRDLPLGPLTHRLEHAAAFYQVALYRRPSAG